MAGLGSGSVGRDGVEASRTVEEAMAMGGGPLSCEAHATQQNRADSAAHERMSPHMKTSLPKGLRTISGPHTDANPKLQRACPNMGNRMSPALAPMVDDACDANSQSVDRRREIPQMVADGRI